MSYQVRDFAREHAGMSDDELLRLALTPQDLLQEARMALQSEMSRRGLKTDRVDAFRSEETQREKSLERETGQRLLSLSWRGIGCARFCKWDQLIDERTRSEEFTTTVFFIFCWVPLFPIGTFRVRRRKRFGERVHVIEKLPLRTNQVLWVYSVTLMLALAIVVLIRLAPRFF